MSLLENIQPAVKKETKRVIVITLVGLILMWVLFAALHFIMPDKVPLDYTVFLGGISWDWQSRKQLPQRMRALPE